MAIVRWEPGRELASMEIDRLNRMFENFYTDAFSRTWTPAVDIYETDDHEVVVKVELPDLKREDISITFENQTLTIRGERKRDESVRRENYQRLERFYGQFTRSFTLPATVDAARISATYRDGVLTVHMPQREEARPKQIEVTAE
jgi:HSP20 family protein